MRDLIPTLATKPTVPTILRVKLAYTMGITPPQNPYLHVVYETPPKGIQRSDSAAQRVFRACGYGRRQDDYLIYVGTPVMEEVMKYCDSMEVSIKDRETLGSPITPLYIPRGIQNSGPYDPHKKREVARFDKVSEDRLMEYIKECDDALQEKLGHQWDKYERDEYHTFAANTSGNFNAYARRGVRQQYHYRMVGLRTDGPYKGSKDKEKKTPAEYEAFLKQNQVEHGHCYLIRWEEIDNDTDPTSMTSPKFSLNPQPVE
jgi:hypothetical protein